MVKHWLESGYRFWLVYMTQHSSNSFTIIRTFIGVGLIVYLGISGAIDWAGLAGLIKLWPLSVAALVVLFLTVLLVSWRLSILLSVQGLRLSLGASLRLNLIGAFFNAFLPGSYGGDVVRMYLAAKPNPGHRTEIATTVVIDRVIGLLALLVFPLLLVFVFTISHVSTPNLGVLLWVVAGTTFMLCAGLAVGAHPRGALRRIASRIFGQMRIGQHSTRFFDTIYAYRMNQENRSTLLGTFVLSLLIQATVVAAILLLVLANGETALNWQVVLVIPLGMLANALPLTPGGLGVGEVAFEALFQSVGATGGAEAILSWRVVTTLIDLCGGALLISGYTDMSMLHRMSGQLPPETKPNSLSRRDANPD